MTTPDDLPAERLRQLLDYNQDTGVFIRRIGSGGRAAGSVAGNVRSDGYVYISIENKRYFAHRLAWLYTVGAWPSGQIDHRDGNTSNNAFANLRDVSQSVNMQNQKRAQRRSQSGVLGASWHEDKRKWMAQIELDGRSRYLGYFDSAEAAHAAYLSAKRQHHIGCTI